MKKIAIKIENIFYKIYKAMYKNKLLVSIKEGFINVIPIFVIGAVALIFQYFPVTFIREFIQTGFSGALNDICQFCYNATFGIASLHILIAITYNYSKTFETKKRKFNIIICMTAFASYFALSGYELITVTSSPLEQKMVIAFEFLNVQNVFLALIVSILSTKLFYFIFDIITSNIRKKEKYNIASESIFRDVMTTIVPMGLTVLAFVIVQIIIKYGLKIDNFNTLVIQILTFPFKHLGRSLISGIIILFLQCLFWFFGIHGSNTFESVNLMIFKDVQDEVLTKTFFDTFVLMGGCGSAICLLIALILFSKTKETKAVTKRSVVSMIFNINEIMVFGLPIVLNPMLIIPFTLTPIFCLLSSYLAISIGLVPQTVTSVMWTTPVLINGYLATSSISGSLLQLFNIIIGVLIYIPFVKMNTRVQKRRYQDQIIEMVQLMKDAEKNQTEVHFLDGNNMYSSIAVTIVNQIRKEIDENNIIMFYQPICDYTGKVISTESLLRFYQEDFTENYIYPPLIVLLANEAGIFNDLTKCIIKKVTTDMKGADLKDVSFSINIQSSQLNDDEFIDFIIEEFKKKNLYPNTLCLELTEESAFIQGDKLPSIIEKLNKAGIKLSIDDFSMGHTSINYLQNNNFDYVKLDGGLIKELDNERVQDIVLSVIRLGKSLNFKVVSEFVEEEKQKEILYNMGCNLYQGYLFSKAIDIEQYKKFVKMKNGN